MRALESLFFLYRVKEDGEKAHLPKSPNGHAETKGGDSSKGEKEEVKREGRKRRTIPETNAKRGPLSPPSPPPLQISLILRFGNVPWLRRLSVSPAGPQRRSRLETRLDSSLLFLRPSLPSFFFFFFVVFFLSLCPFPLDARHRLKYIYCRRVEPPRSVGTPHRVYTPSSSPLTYPMPSYISSRGQIMPVFLSHCVSFPLPWYLFATERHSTWTIQSPQHSTICEGDQTFSL